MHMLLHLLGLDSATGTWYLFFSGFGSDIAEFALVGAIFRTAYKVRQQHSRHHKELMTKLTERNPE